ASPSATRLVSRFLQTSRVQLDWSAPNDQKFLARVVNGRTTPTDTPDVLATGPDRSDERDRDIIRQTLDATVAVSASKNPSKLLVITRFDREGIAWHHLAPHLITPITATASGKPLPVQTIPRRMHNQAGAWSWVLHEFDVP